jgi:cytochrome c553
MVVLRAAIASLLFVAACDVGEVPTSGANPGPDAPVGGSDAGGTDASVPVDPAAAFVSKIQPLVTRCTGCHSGGQKPNLTSYTALESQYKMHPGASNILVTKGVPSGHNGEWFTSEQRDTIAKWIDSIP